MFQNRELPSFIIHYLYALKRLIKAERTSNGHYILSQPTLNKSNVSASSGHINYAKLARMYYQHMQNITEQYPWLYKTFAPTLHGVRRSDSRLVACGATYY